MDEKRLIKTSKYLSRHLRHQPERLGLHPDPQGWVPVDELLRACASRSVELSRADLEEVVARNDKRRFSFDPTGTRLRANQGHSIEIDLGLDPVSPPPQLFHGTGRASVEAIMRAGLQRMGRHHVHLSADVETARRVGARHGSPVVLEVAAGRMTDAGYTFLLSDNGVWLTHEVPAEYLSPRPGSAVSRP